MELKRVSYLKGEIRVPGDKSISHRAVMFGSIAEGLTEIHNFLQGAGCLSTIACFEKMDISVEDRGGQVLVHGHGLHGLEAPREILDCGNSDTTTRLISGILCAQESDVILTGDESICRRPMKCIMDSLIMMGAHITSIESNGCTPLCIRGGPVHGIHHDSGVASAQVKSAIMLAGSYADSPTNITEPYVSRNHLEPMLRFSNVQVSTEGTTAVIKPASELHGNQVMVPGDISSAAYSITGGLMMPGSEVLIRNVGINPIRDGILRVCRDMGAHIELLNVGGGTGKQTADILVRYGSLHGTVIGGAAIPTLIDELPVTTSMACLAEGETIIRDAGELRVKESNRIAVMVQGLAAMGADVAETEGGMIIRGGAPLHGAAIDSRKDHCIATTSAVTALCADGITEIKDADCVNISYPGFYSDLKRLA